MAVQAPASHFDAMVGLVRRHEERFRSTLNLIASENLLSPAARWALGGDLAHRYCIPPEGERHPALWDYPNQDAIRAVHALTEQLACEVFRAKASDIRPLSGNNAAFIALKALLAPGARVASVPADCGGHFATDEICKREGFERVDLPYDRERGELDVVAAADLCESRDVSVVFLDASTLLLPHPVSALRAAVPENTAVLYDASHVMGLIAGGEFQDPLAEGADALQGSTHKSLPGPQKGLFAFRERGDVCARIQGVITPLFVSNSHSHHVAALCVTLAEMHEFGRAYASQVVANATALAGALHGCGEDVLLADRGFTRSHQVVWVVGDHATALRQVGALELAGMHVNLIRAPFTGGQFGFRLGASELTRRGMGEEQLRHIGRLLVQAARAHADATTTFAEVAELSAAYPTTTFGYPAPT